MSHKIDFLPKLLYHSVTIFLCIAMRYFNAIVMRSVVLDSLAGTRPRLPTLVLCDKFLRHGE